MKLLCISSVAKINRSRVGWHLPGFVSGWEKFNSSILFIIRKHMIAAQLTQAPEPMRWSNTSWRFLQTGKVLVSIWRRRCWDDEVEGLCHTALRTTLKPSEAIAVFAGWANPCFTNGPIASSISGQGACSYSRTSIYAYQRRRGSNAYWSGMLIWREFIILAWKIVRS